MKPDYAAMSKAELKAYVLEHGWEVVGEGTDKLLIER